MFLSTRCQQLFARKSQIWLQKVSNRCNHSTPILPSTQKNRTIRFAYNVKVRLNFFLVCLWSKNLSAKNVLWNRETGGNFENRFTTRHDIGSSYLSCFSRLGYFSVCFRSGPNLDADIPNCTVDYLALQCGLSITVYLLHALCVYWVCYHYRPSWSGTPPCRLR